MINLKQRCTLVVSGNGFKTVFVLNKDGKTYYMRKFDTPQTVCKIRIPDIGQYSVILDGKGLGLDSIKFEKLVPAKFQVTMPFRQRNRAKPYEIVTNYSLTHTPARIHTFSGRIEVSPQFHTFPIFAQKFIIYHELGHFYYQDEPFADMFAAKMMLEKGYNPTSIMYTLINVLKRSPLATERLRIMFKNLDS
jgi:hypothetical protein